jgi:integral membrane protein
MNSTVKIFCAVALLEGISYIVLLGIAMPLKYMLHLPVAVKVAGWAHGVLFIAYILLLVVCWFRNRWHFGRVLFYFLASLLPILPFFIERNLRREYKL